MLNSKQTNCYVCSRSLTANAGSDEHIIPNAIGGRLRSASLLCRECNNTFGTKYEAEFIDQLRFFSGRLPIKRERGSNRKFETVDRMSGLPIVVDDEGRVSLAHVVMQKPPLTSNGGTFRFITPTQAHADRIIETYRRKFPQAKINVCSSDESTSNSHIEIGGSLGGLAFFKSTLKCLLNLYVHEGGEIGTISETAKDLFFTDKEPSIWFYTDANSGAKTELVHTLAVFGRPEQRLLFGFVEFFGAVRLIGILDDNYTGPPVYFTHAVDPIKGLTLKCDVTVNLNRDQILSLIANKPLNFSEFSAQLGAAENNIRSVHYFSKIVTEVMKRTLFRTENRGSVITESMISEFTAELVDALMPNILAASEERRAKAEEEFRRELEQNSKTYGNDV